jgi:hypothetical protein
MKKKMSRAKTGRFGVFGQEKRIEVFAIPPTACTLWHQQMCISAYPMQIMVFNFLVNPIIGCII